MDALLQDGGVMSNLGKQYMTHCSVSFTYTSESDKTCSFSLPCISPVLLSTASCNLWYPLSDRAVPA